jgi:hypothetical protein
MATAISSETNLALSATVASLPGYKEVRNIFNSRVPGPYSATITVGTEATNEIIVSLIIKDLYGNAVTQRTQVTLLLLADANGDAFNAADYTIAAGTNGDLIQVTADKVIRAMTEANGTLDVSLTIVGAATSYLAVVLATGRLSVSGAITHA